MKETYYPPLYSHPKYIYMKLKYIYKTLLLSIRLVVQYELQNDL